jgi:hypothetical protein
MEATQKKRMGNSRSVSLPDASSFLIVEVLGIV